MANAGNNIFASNEGELSTKIIQRMLLFLGVCEGNLQKRNSEVLQKLKDKTAENKLAILDLRWITENKSTTSLHTQLSNKKYSMLHNAPIHHATRLQLNDNLSCRGCTKSNKQIELKRSQRSGCPRKRELFSLKSNFRECFLHHAADI